MLKVKYGKHKVLRKNIQTTECWPFPGVYITRKNHTATRCLSA